MSAADAAVSDAEAAALFADLVTLPALVLAVSGGPDSTALMVLSARWRAKLGDGPTLHAVTVDHGLRPGSGAEAAAVKELAREIGVAHRTVRWRGDKPATHVQEAAREARYRLLAKQALATGASRILTGHTLDDQAETVLFRLVRGSGIAGLAGMARETRLNMPDSRAAHAPAAEVVLVRPFLDIPKARLIATVEAAGISFADDSSNRDPRFTRTRLRRIMAALEPEGLNAGKLAQLARRARRIDAAIEWASGAAQEIVRGKDKDEVAMDAAAWRALPAEIALRLLRGAIERVGSEGPVELAKLEALAGSIQAASAAKPDVRWRRTLAGALIILSGGQLRVVRAPARQHRPAAG